MKLLYAAALLACATSTLISVSASSRHARSLHHLSGNHFPASSRGLDAIVHQLEELEHRLIQLEDREEEKDEEVESESESESEPEPVGVLSSSAVSAITGVASMVWKDPACTINSLPGSYYCIALDVCLGSYYSFRGWIFEKYTADATAQTVTYGAYADESCSVPAEGEPNHRVDPMQCTNLHSYVPCTPSASNVGNGTNTFNVINMYTTLDTNCAGPSAVNTANSEPAGLCHNTTYVYQRVLYTSSYAHVRESDFVISRQEYSDDDCRIFVSETKYNVGQCYDNALYYNRAYVTPNDQKSGEAKGFNPWMPPL